MKPTQERDALKEFLHLADDPKSAAKNSFQWSIVYLICCCVLLAVVVVSAEVGVELSRYALSFAAGIFGAFAYSRYIESLGVKFISKYVNSDQIRENYKELADKFGESKDSVQSPIKSFIRFSTGVIMVYFVLRIVTNYLIT